jgi:hypothetical protein
MEKDEAVLIEYRVGKHVYLYALLCQQCEVVKPVVRLKVKLICQACHSQVGVLMPEDYTKNLLEGGRVH